MLHRSKGGTGGGEEDQRPGLAFLQTPVRSEKSPPGPPGPPCGCRDEVLAAAPLYGAGLSPTSSWKWVRLREMNADSIKAFGLKLSPSIISLLFN